MRRSALVPFLIALNVLVYFAWSTQLPGIGPSFMYENFLCSWSALVEGRFWTLLTAAFSHNMLWHLAVNMMVLWSFGSAIEIVLGRRFFISFYLGAAIVSSLAHSLVSAFLLDEPGLPMLGASGALAGVVLIFAMIFPREKILIFGLIPVPALFGALAFMALDVWGLMAQARGGGLPIGHGAHLGGALTGILVYFFILRPRILRRRAQLESMTD